jgi:hypothetical protein
MEALKKNNLLLTTRKLLPTGVLNELKLLTQFQLIHLREYYQIL